VFTLAKGFDDEGEVEEAEEEHVEFLEAGEEAAEALAPAEEPFDLVAFPVEDAVVLPRFDAVRSRRNDRNQAQRQHQLPRFFSLLGPVPQHRQAFRQRPQIAQQLTALRRIVRRARRQGEG
jgi:hypothetical protein